MSIQKALTIRNSIAVGETRNIAPEFLQGELPLICPTDVNRVNKIQASTRTNQQPKHPSTPLETSSIPKTNHKIYLK